MRKLKTVFIAIFFCVWFNFSFAQSDQNMAQDQEVLELEKFRTWDFGEVKEGGFFEHDFSLRNDTAEVLQIKNIDTSCGCTTSEVSKKTLAPGEKTELKVKFNSKGYSGKVRQFIFVNTDNLDKPVIQFVIKADVKK